MEIVNRLNGRSPRIVTENGTTCVYRRDGSGFLLDDYGMRPGDRLFRVLCAFDQVSSEYLIDVDAVCSRLGVSSTEEIDGLGFETLIHRSLYDEPWLGSGDTGVIVLTDYGRGVRDQLPPDIIGGLVQTKMEAMT